MSATADGITDIALDRNTLSKGVWRAPTWMTVSGVAAQGGGRSPEGDESSDGRVLDNGLNSVLEETPVGRR